MVAVSVPVTVFVLLGGRAVDDKVAGGIVVKTADDIEQGSLTAAGVTKDRNEFIFTEADADTAQGSNFILTASVLFNNIF